MLVTQVLHHNGVQPAVHDSVTGPSVRSGKLLLRLRRAGDALLEARPARQALRPIKPQHVSCLS